MEPRQPATDVERIATMQTAGLPFDLAVMMAVDWDAVENDIRVRDLVSSFVPTRPLEKLAIVALAYYQPHRLLGHETVKALVDYQADFFEDLGLFDQEEE